jgi:hypothetical protein
MILNFRQVWHENQFEILQPDSPIMGHRYDSLPSLALINLPWKIELFTVRRENLLIDFDMKYLWKEHPLMSLSR